MLAFELCEDPDIIPAIAFVIAAHHTGLNEPSHLASREFEQYGSNWQIALKTAKTEIAEILPKSLPDINLPTLRREFAIRMLFSALIDSDRIDAMNFEQNTKTPNQRMLYLHNFSSLVSQVIYYHQQPPRLIGCGTSLLNIVSLRQHLQKGYFALQVRVELVKPSLA